MIKGFLKSDQRGAVTIVEATFVFPIMFFILFFLLFYGNAVYVNNTVSAVVSKYAIEAAAEISDPILKQINEDGSVPTTYKDGNPYRYMTTSYGNSIVSRYKTKITNEIKSAGIFTKMAPKVVSCKAKYKNYFLYQTVRYDLTYDIKMPIKIIFAESPIVVKFCSSDEVPICDSSEMVLNTNMVIDYVERSGLADKISQMTDKVKKLFG